MAAKSSTASKNSNKSGILARSSGFGLQRDLGGLVLISTALVVL